MGVGFGNHAEIGCEVTIDGIMTLFERGYQVISKSDNTVTFTRWTRFRRAGLGIAYVTDHRPISRRELPFLALLEPIDPEGGARWYYFVDDFTEWRRRYR